jgi:hypothetical protein
VDIDSDKIDEAVLALLCLTLHDGAPAWKGFDWDSLNRFHEGLHVRSISDPVGKARSVVLTDEGPLTLIQASQKRNRASDALRIATPLMP